MQDATVRLLDGMNNLGVRPTVIPQDLSYSQ